MFEFRKAAKTTSGTEDVLILSRPEDLHQLTRRHKKPLRIRINAASHIDDTRRTVLERRVTRYMTACGCDQGAIFGALYLILIPTLLFTHILAPRSILSWIGIVGGFIAVLIGGKLVGLAVARLLLLRTIAKLRNIL